MRAILNYSDMWSAHILEIQLKGHHILIVRCKAFWWNNWIRCGNFRFRWIFFHPILNVRLFDEIINSKLGIFVFGDFFPLYGLGLSLSHKVGIFSIFGRNFVPTLWLTTVVYIIINIYGAFLSLVKVNEPVQVHA